ncbi:hypothetical protein [Clostridium perfringens]|uniref:hypothetical protein n=1 Tax=Clostridium perfringens TaxID=1502 RepID=UPI0008A6DCE1|nr:hypothetical protein [Clostridium perfringens]AOY53329.1 hypothetical protein FORC25_0911 [Clostridium perfringens]MDK0679968.1 hypothetical protein [Clostridium perfringens]MDK0856436.1 hypothetical protein [Clostridium perfringens]UUW66888.1 hypothetical protein NQ197_04710 [Clostridium perfringens]HAT4103696.1 hypothetical protein [Clostridium perfringens]
MKYKAIELLKDEHIGKIVQSNDGFVYVVTDELDKITLNLAWNKEPVVLSSNILEKEFKDITEEYWNSSSEPVLNSDIPF